MKKGLSLFLALALAFSMSVTALAEGPAGTPAPAVGASTTQEAEQDPADNGQDPADTTANGPASSTPADSEPADSTPADSEPADSEPADSEPADSQPADSQPADSEPADSEPAEEAGEEAQDGADVPAVTSLLPIQEKNAYLFLNRYTDEQLKAMSLSTLLKELRDDANEPIVVPADAKIVWGYVKASSPSAMVWDDADFDVLEQDATVDMKDYSTRLDYYLQIIIGTGEQLDYDATRYIVHTFITPAVIDGDTGTYGGYESKVYYKPEGLGANGINLEPYSFTVYSPSAAVTKATNIPTMQFTYFAPKSRLEGSGYSDPKTARFEFALNSNVRNNRPDIDVNAYKMKDVLDYIATGNDLVGKDLSGLFNYASNQLDTHYACIPQPTDDPNADNVICLVYTDKASGKVLGYQGIIFVVTAGDLTTNGYGVPQGTLASGMEYYYGGNYGPTFGIDITSGAPLAGNDINDVGDIFRTTDPAALQKDDTYKLGLPADLVKKVVIGHYNSEEQVNAAGAAAVDVTRQIAPVEGSGIAGLPVNFKNGQYVNQDGSYWFTVICNNNAIFKLTLRAYTYSTGSSTSTTRIPNDNYITGTDPWLNMTGAVGVDSKDIYRVANDYYMSHYATLDTVYGKGYQTILINDPDVDLTKLVPEFTTGKDVRVFAVSPTSSDLVTSGDPDSAQDFSTGPVQYTIMSGGHERNYVVNFVKKVTGEAKLFVNGPDTREVFLTNYFENQHNIFIANIGDQPLENIKVELKDGQHVKLDDYWTLNGGAGATLQGFTTTDARKTDYGLLPNVARIRLLPDGEGEISGTLVITADGQEPVEIELTGVAANPQIITTQLKPGVKYVPYSHVIATNNMNYELGDATFEITSGGLPAGVTLDEGTGELYGVPLASDTYRIQVKASFDEYYFEDSYATLVLDVADNTNSNVYNSSDDGYSLLNAVGIDQGDYDFYLPDLSADQVFRSEGVLDEFIDFWLNGEKLVRGTDYIAESGSTRITIRSQTLQSKAKAGQANTLAAEFRTGGTHEGSGGTVNELHRTAQNLRVTGSGASSGSGDGGTGGAGGIGGGSSSPYTTMVVRLIDGNDRAVPGTVLELHSTPQVTYTDEDGYGVFSLVEFGSHSLTVSDTAGNVLASRQFYLNPGRTSLNGSTITVPRGSTFTLTVRLKNGRLTFVSLSSVPRTADDSDPGLWLALLLLSGTGAVLSLYAYRKRRKGYAA